MDYGRCRCSYLNGIICDSYTGEMKRRERVFVEVSRIEMEHLVFFEGENQAVLQPYLLFRYLRRVDDYNALKLCNVKTAHDSRT